MAGPALNADLVGVLWRTVQLRRISSGPKDRYGTVTDVLGDPEDVAAYFEVKTSTETAAVDRERRQEALLVIMPGIGAKARDMFEVDGASWVVSGEPITYDALVAGAPHHTECTLLRIAEGP